MFDRYNFYFLLQIIAILVNDICDGDPLIGKNVQLAKKVVTGSIDFEFGQLYKVKECITYDDWAREYNIIPQVVDNDIAIITLSQNVKDNIVPAKISKLKQDEVIGKRVVTAGRGLTNDSKFSRPDSLRKTYSRVITAKEFKQNEIALFGWADDMPLNKYATVAKPPVVASSGDSGSLLVLACNQEIVGINDSGCDIRPEENPNVMSLYISVDYYREFIEFMLNDEQNAASCCDGMLPWR